MQQLVELGQAVHGHHEVRDVPELERAPADRDESGPTPFDAYHLDLAGRLHRGHRLARQVLGDLALQVEQRAAGEAVLELLLPVEQEELDPGSRPFDGGDGGDVQAFVDLGSPGVVDAGDHLRDVVVLTGDAGGDDVGVVPVRHGHEGSRVPDTRLLQDLPVEPEADDGLGLEPGREPVEGLGSLVDDGDRVAALGQLDREGAAHPAASHDDDVHGGKD